jgi:hypothetical protein
MLKSDTYGVAGMKVDSMSCQISDAAIKNTSKECHRYNLRHVRDLQNYSVIAIHWMLLLSTRLCYDEIQGTDVLFLDWAGSEVPHRQSYLGPLTMGVHEGQGSD